MNPVTSSMTSPVVRPKADKGSLYSMANTFFKAPAAVDSWTREGLAKEDAFLGKLRRWTRQFVGNRLKELVDYDYREFPALVLGKHSIPLAEPPKGALLLLLYPGTVIPRLYRAYQRGKQNNDFREMGDVLRRDLTAITLFVFALGPVVRNLTALTEKISGVKLLDPNSKQVLKYSQFKNYEIDSERALKAILTEGNGDALVSAVNKLHDRGLNSKYGDGTLQKEIKAIQTSVNKLVEEFKTHNGAEAGRKVTPSPVWGSKSEGCLKEAYDAIKGAESRRNSALEAAKAGGSAETVKVLKRMEGEFKGVLQNSAKVHRLPSDLVSFAILVGAIGYLPMWINTEWNKRQFEKKMAAKAEADKSKQAPQPAAQPTAKAQPAAQANTQIPVLPQPPAVAQGPAFGTFGQTVPQPFSMLNRQMPANPFNRLG